MVIICQEGGSTGFFLIFQMQSCTLPYNSQILFDTTRKGVKKFPTPTKIAAKRFQKCLFDCFNTGEKLFAGASTAIESSDND